MIAWVSKTFFKNNVYTVRSGLLNGMQRRGGLGWVPGGAGETAESIFWLNAPLAGRVIYDVGAFHGLLTLFFARQGSRVVAYEPNSVNRQRLEENVRLNQLQNVVVRPMGLGETATDAVLTWDPLTPGGGRTDPAANSDVGASDSSLTESIRIGTMDEEVGAGSLPAPEFIKIDVEGNEIYVLRGARETIKAHKPEIFLELHGSTMREKREKTEELVDFVAEAGYNKIFHIESETMLRPGQEGIPPQGHLYCTASEA